MSRLVSKDIARLPLLHMYHRYSGVEWQKRYQRTEAVDPIKLDQGNITSQRGPNGRLGVLA